jgi:4-nitrophenyl phosphatase
VAAWVLDLDGVLWRGDRPIAGAADAVRRLRAAGERVAFVTNNARPTHAEMAAKLAAHDIEAGDDLITSPMAAAALVFPRERVLVLGGAGAAEAVAERGAVAIDPAALVPTDAAGAVDVVLVGLHVDFDYHRLAVAAAAVHGGARLVATNDDSSYPADGVLLPGAGAIVAAVERATGVRAVVAGKPHDPMVRLVRGRLGEDGIVVGDRADTDGAFAVALGWTFGLVLSGVTGAADLPTDPPADVTAADLGALVEVVLGRREAGI